MTIENITSKLESHSIKKFEAYLDKLRKKKPSEFDRIVNKLKVIFINSNDIVQLNKIALVFSTFKIHSSVPLIISRLLKNKSIKQGGTLLYALLGLRKSEFKSELQGLWQKNISYEMQQMLELNRINKKI